MRKKIYWLLAIIGLCATSYAGYGYYQSRQVLDIDHNTAVKQVMTNTSDKTLYTKIKQTGYYDQEVTYVDGTVIKAVGLYYQAGDQYELTGQGEAVLTPAKFQQFTGQRIQLADAGYYYCDAQLAPGNYQISLEGDSETKDKTGAVLEPSAQLMVARQSDMNQSQRGKAIKGQAIELSDSTTKTIRLKKGDVLKLKTTANYVVLDKE